MPPKSNTLFRFLSSLTLLLAVGIEANHSFVQREPWSGFTLATNYFSYPLIVAWCLALVGIWSPNANFKPLMFIGIFFIFMHGSIIALGDNTLVGAIYMALGVLSGIFAAISHRNESVRIRQNSRPHLKLAS